MRLVIEVIVLSTVGIGFGIGAHAADSRVRGHITKNGTFVAPHHRTTPDGSKANNFSSKGNVNPYTGKEGNQDPLKK